MSALEFYRERFGCDPASQEGLREMRAAVKQAYLATFGRQAAAFSNGDMRREGGEKRSTFVNFFGRGELDRIACVFDRFKPGAGAAAP